MLVFIISGSRMTHVIFFFSSRRRHTRWNCDWSSDVCSSDLFECWWPHQLFGNRKAERAGMLMVHPWADDRPVRARKRRGAILRENWRERFENFARGLSGSNIYVTIDLDCLEPNLAWTNWENGKIDFEDVRWGLATLRQHARVAAGDMCGAYSVP